MGEQTVQTEEKGLSTFKDKETQIEEVVSELAPFPGIQNPYPNQTPTAITERWFAIDAFTLNDSTTVTLHQTNGVDYLLNQLPITKATATFRYFRFKSIEYRLQYSTTPFLYGCGFASSLPLNAYRATSLRQFASHTDSVMFDFSEQQDVTIVSPWISPSQWIDLSQYNSSGYTPITLLNLHPLSLVFQAHAIKRLNTDTTQIVHFQIFARFQGVEVAGPMSDNNFTARPVFQSQMKAQSPGQYVQNVLTAGGAGVAMASQVFNLAMRGSGGSVPVPSEATQALSDIVQGQNGKMPRRKQNRQKKTNPEDDQSEQDFKPNVFGSMTYSRSRYVLGTGSQIAETRRHSIMSIISKPTLLYNQDLVSGFNYLQIATPGIIGPAFSLTNGRYSRVDYVAQMFRLWRGSLNFTIIFVSSPFISARYNVILSYLDASFAPAGYLGSEIIEDITIRGTTVVNFSVPYLVGTQWSRTAHQISANVIDNPPDYALASPAIWLKEINPAFASGDVTPVIPMYLYMSAGKDFEFRSMICPSPVSIPSGEKKFQSQMRVSTFCGYDPVFNGSSTFPNAADDDLDVEGMCQRWNVRSGSSFPVQAMPRPPTWNSQSLIDTRTLGGVVSCYDLWANLFMYFSGQTKLKIPFQGTVTNFSNFMVKMDDNGVACTTSQYKGGELANRSEDGLALTSQNISNVIECTVPFLSSYQYLPVQEWYIQQVQLSSVGDWSPYCVFYDPVTDYNFIPDIGTSTSTFAPNYYWVAAGDDFSFFYDIPPPELTKSFGSVAGSYGPNPWPRYDSTYGISNSTSFYQFLGSKNKNKSKPFTCTTCGKDCRVLGSSSCSESITFSRDEESSGY